MRIFAIDGASRGNGTPECVAGAGVFIYNYDRLTDRRLTAVHHGWEIGGSSNQRGELMALWIALKFVDDCRFNEPGIDDTAAIITDSEYIYNMMSKDWLQRWATTGWSKADGTPVKNQDILVHLHNKLNELAQRDVEVMFYHIKGHLYKLAPILAAQLMIDGSGVLVYDEVYNSIVDMQEDRYLAMRQLADECSIKNHGYAYDTTTLRMFAAANAAADQIAQSAVNHACTIRSVAVP
jgi:ribonuclease HI